MTRDSRREWCVVDLLKTTAEYFALKEVDEPRLGAEMLLSHLFGENRLWLYLNHNRPVSDSELAVFREFCRQRLDGRPVQYITGEQYFYGKPFMVDERVLIPRPETELLVEHAAGLLSAGRELNPEGEYRLLDIGTGSGCIAVTLASLLPFLQLAAIDRSAPALDVARANAMRHGMLSRIDFLEADLFDPELASRCAGPFDMIVSNPPYIPETEWEELQPEVRRFEPRDALVTPGGTASYLAICRASSELLKPEGLLCLEIHADAAMQVCALMESEKFRDISVLKDYAGFDRIVSGRLGA
ncbi:MAG: peptide chain release factor N(5)-glutamine methyltransferase [Chlorobium sp.]|uniref:peptide chain release factor N(5)-glutamine methyltransferase n=1 Tax=Chlorobium sp. TaxID=1095 RepID=UPI0025B8463B|nr:peptide chain release factor N(5)-glutamine methyltransferase [Chlorobium sp.]MCF8382671.1 peptide chain release factor N(5)-glutamine methyltransferase [Chlorobium sp.]